VQRQPVRRLRRGGRALLREPDVRYEPHLHHGPLRLIA
jgi:hypothetical protein